MSCCAGCLKGYGCSSNFPSFGLTGLMAGTTVAAGSHIQAGFHFNFAATSAQNAEGWTETGFIIDSITFQLYKYGLFSAVNVSVQPPAYLGLQGGYITVDGWITQDYPTVMDMQTAIKQGIQDSGVPISITGADTPNVQEVPANRPDAVQPYTTNPAANPNANPEECDWNSMSFGTYIACQLGIKSAVAGVEAGAVGAVVAVGFLVLASFVLIQSAKA